MSYLGLLELSARAVMGSFSFFRKYMSYRAHLIKLLTSDLWQ